MTKPGFKLKTTPRAIGHTWYVCPGRHDRPNSCQFCDGGLGWCTRCDGFEGQLTRECPGRKMTAEEKERVYAGTLNFVRGRWIVKRAKTKDTWRCQFCGAEAASKDWKAAKDVCPKCRKAYDPILAQEGDD